MNSRNYLFLADSEYQWARYHLQRGDIKRFWARYTNAWRYLGRTLQAFGKERYDSICKHG